MMSHPPSRRSTSDLEGHDAVSVHSHPSCAREELSVGPVSRRMGQGGAFPWRGRTAAAMLPCSPLTQKAPCQHAKSPESSGPPGILRLAEFQSYTRGLIFQADFPPSQRLPENISLPLKVRALETGSKFRIVYLAPEPELVILNWAIGLSIFAALPHQFK